jgi:hypothetical protein
MVWLSSISGWAELFMEDRLLRFDVLYYFLIIDFFGSIFYLSKGYLFKFRHYVEDSIWVQEAFREPLAFVEDEVNVNVVKDVLFELTF